MGKHFWVSELITYIYGGLGFKAFVVSLFFDRFCSKTLNGHDDWVRFVSIDDSGKFFVSCSNDQVSSIQGF